MKTYEVIIRAIVTKTYTIDAESEEEATNTGHEIFSVLNDDVPENYEQDLISCEELT